MSVVRRPHITEKAMDLMDFENKMQFIVDTEASKDEIEGDIESMWDVEVSNVNTMITMKGEKKAIVEFVEDGAASDVASRMGAF